MNGLFLCLSPQPNAMFLPLGIAHATDPVSLLGVIHDLVHHLDPAELPAAIEPMSFEAELLALGTFAYSIPHNKDWLHTVEQEVEILIEPLQRVLVPLPVPITDRLGLIESTAYDWLLYGYAVAEAKWPEFKGRLDKHRTGIVEDLEHHHFQANQCYLFEPKIELAQCEVTWVFPCQLKIEVNQP